MKTYIFFHHNAGYDKTIYLIFASEFKAKRFRDKNPQLIMEEWEVIQ